MRRRYDVVILGGGPAGSATALALARSRCSIAVLESSTYDRVRIGETLPPIARVPLTRLGVWERFIAERHAPSPGNVSAWGQAEPYEEQFIFNAYGPGWHLDRTRFDAMLASAAEQAGTTLFRGARLKSCIAMPGGDWEVGFMFDGALRNMRTTFLVDATGRAASHARHHGARRLTYDRLVGVAGLFRPCAAREEPDTRTLVEACELGWWYSAGLPNGRLITAFMTDADLLPSGVTGVREHWRRQLERAPHTHARVAGRLSDTPLRVVTARTDKLDRVTGPRWLAVGDAALTFDPLSSHGITTALQCGLSAGSTIERWSNGQRDALVEYERDAQTDFDHYLRARAVQYGRERRWPASAFWRRRHPTSRAEAAR
jgi:flavin-dependent dehydrogenase